MPAGATAINDNVSVWRDDEMGKWVYYQGLLPIYSHGAKDSRLFHFVTAQLIEAGACRQVEIINTFGVSKSSVARSVRTLRTKGIDGFLRTNRRRRGGAVLTSEKLQIAQELLNKGESRGEVAANLGIKYDTLRKAINQGRLREGLIVENVAWEATGKSSRSVVDAEAAEGMGTACLRTAERVLAAKGKLNEAEQRFEPCLDVPNGGVLCALPALLGNGLFHGIDGLGKVKGYYSRAHVLLLLAIMALCRIRTVEQLRSKAPGELGRLIGLDRVPEVRCLRRKLDELSGETEAETWAAQLSAFWMKSEPEAVGELYVDGHVRTYHGRKTKLPRRYISRERLCLRGTTDYWVNDATGKPFFVVEKPIDAGMLKALREDIVPRLLDDVPNQPGAEALEANPHLSRFLLVFDREGYSPAFFAEMWETHRIACMTYHKFPSAKWPEDQFTQREVMMPSGETVKMRLAEMASLIGSKKSIWVKEVRKLTEGGHQCSIVSTAYDQNSDYLAPRMFSRWCQENFFRYAMQHYSLDMLTEYGLRDLPDTERVVNPSWRELERQRRSVQTKLIRLKAKFAEFTITPEPDPDSKKHQKWLAQKASALEDVEHLENQIQIIKKQRGHTPKHVTLAELPKSHRFQRLVTNRKRLMDTVRMIAYRAETAMAAEIAFSLSQSTALAPARTLLQNLFVSEADILPDLDAQTIRVRVHASSRPASDRLLFSFFERLNETEFNYPGTTYRMIFELTSQPVKYSEKVSPQLPRGKES